MKLLSIITKPSPYMRDFYLRHPLLTSQSFEDQHEALVDDTYGGSEIWSTGLLEFGYQSQRIFVNIPEIQKRWAQEQGLVYDESNWLENIARSQIKKYQPDLLFISNYSTFSADFVKSLRNDVPSIRLIIGWCGAPYHDPAIFCEYDFVLSNVPELVKDFQANGHCCYHLNHAFDPRLLKKIDASQPPNVNFSFVGSIVKAAGYHNRRETILLDLLKYTEIEIWSAIERPTLGMKMKKRAVLVSYDLIQYALRSGLPKDRLAKIPRLGKFAQFNVRPYTFVDSRLAKRANPPLFGLPMIQKLRDSKVTLNTHIDVAQTSASNMRLFEATGVGTCLLTDWKANLKELFEPEVDVATYRDSKECIEKVQHLLQNEKERQAMAESGQRRALRDHTIYHRAEQLDEIIREHLKKS